MFDNDITREEQVGIPSFAPEINKNISVIDWRKSSEEIHNLVRGIVHWPKATTKLKIKNKEMKLKLLQTKVLSQRCDLSYDCGSIVKVDNDGLVVKCGQNTLLKIIMIQPENRKVMTIKEFLCGYKIVAGEKFF
ncbi:MAG: hypothetical protein SNJ64_01290 [Endomicrobiia bacterium]